jgi:hypothetical protein
MKFLLLYRFFWRWMRLLIRWAPFLCSFAFIYMLAGGLGMVPSWWNCRFYHGTTITLLDMEFNISAYDCSIGPFYSEMPTIVRVSQRGDLFSTKIFEYGADVDLTIDALDHHTVRIAVPARFGESARGIDVHEVYAQRSEWRGIRFVYEQSDPDERGK